MAVTPSLKELKTILKPMSWRDRMEYLWTYYKLVLVAVICVAAVISLIVSSIQNRQIDTIYGGMLIGVNMTEEGMSMLSDELEMLFEGDGQMRVVELTDVDYVSSDDPSDMESNQAAQVKLMLMVAANRLDYVLADQGAYDDLLKLGGYADLRQILSQEQQALMSSYYVWTEETEDLPSYPMALDISHIPFAKTCAPYNDVLYLVFPGNTDNTQRNSAFIDFLLNWQAQ